MRSLKAGLVLAVAILVISFGSEGESKSVGLSREERSPSDPAVNQQSEAVRRQRAVSPEKKTVGKKIKEALFTMAQTSDELREFHIREEDSRNLRSLRLPSKEVRQAEETEVDKLGEEPRNPRSLGVPESQVKWGRQKKTAKKMNAEALNDLSSMKKAKKPKRLNQYGWAPPGANFWQPSLCDCSYDLGGCGIKTPPPAGWACQCRYAFLWYCTGRAFKCPSSRSCPADCTEEQCCLRAVELTGHGNCGGYPPWSISPGQ